MDSRISAPDYLPRLCAGRHRSSRRGACFMEFASYLAGERWSDHPSCTDPVLAALARAVNDLVSDAQRQDLLGDVPRVIGLRGGAELGLIAAASAAASALPVASMHRQRALAVGLRAIVATLDEFGVAVPALRRRVALALDAAPGAVQWIEEHPEFTGRIPRGRYERAGLEIIRVAACGVAEACVWDSDPRLVRMLRDAVVAVELQVRTPVVARAATPAAPGRQASVSA